MKKLGVQLKNARKQAGLTQQDVASKSGVTRQTVSYIESGQHRTDAVILAQVADALGFRLSLVAKKPLSHDVQAAYDLMAQLNQSPRP